MAARVEGPPPARSGQDGARGFARDDPYPSEKLGGMRLRGCGGARQGDVPDAIAGDGVDRLVGIESDGARKQWIREIDCHPEYEHPAESDHG
jgi:hypothetical protein